MLNSIRIRLSYLLSVLTLAVMVSASGVVVDGYLPVDLGLSVHAADDDEDEDDGPREPPRARQAQQLSRSVYSRIEKVQEAMEESDYATALEELAEVNDLLERDRLNPYEQFMLYQFSSQIAIEQGRMEDALDFFLRALEVEDLLPRQYAQLHLNVGGLQFQFENYPEAIEHLLQHLELDDDPSNDVYLRIAYGYYVQELYEDALPWAEEYLERARADGEEVKMDGYRLTGSIYRLLERWADARQLSRELIVMYDMPKDWDEYAQSEGAMDRFDERLKIEYVSNLKGNFERENQYVNLAAQIYGRDNPYGAAKILEEGMSVGIVDEDDPEILDFLSICYQQARELELAISPLERAIELTSEDKGELNRRLGIIHYQLENYEEAIDAFQKAYASDDLEEKATVLFYMADSHTRINEYDEAIERVREAGRIDPEEADAASQRARGYTRLRDRYLDNQTKRRELAEYFR